MARRLNIIYFAWVKERLGRGEETLEIPANVSTVGELITHLAMQNGDYASAFADPKKLRFALDQNFMQADAPLGEAKELAIFPPVTGG
ncbi:hypothetical protein MNBD_ALPHA04-180 [hydrothermal vent metagenome]|uniref:Molybdopterin synthase sulfur carrier subunit n=1 Tax=hydrothermal vent metagenome TaxID=652676 RepID=A0A3B0S7A5_9ZZZZ